MISEIIAIILLAISNLVFLWLFLYYRFRHRRVIMSIAQLIVDKEVLLDKIDSMSLENSNEANEGFIRFLSDSREAAFSYIENVQKSIQEYLDALNTGTEDQIVTARMELFSHLPEKTE